uniref:Uncharacterized protein n=1 Tax=Cacopsylla melanoneura TaxID=428564 RepID=A0A8D8XZM8_9HEMI
MSAFVLDQVKISKGKVKIFFAKYCRDFCLLYVSKLIHLPISKKIFMEQKLQTLMKNCGSSTWHLTLLIRIVNVFYGTEFEWQSVNSSNIKCRVVYGLFEPFG